MGPWRYTDMILSDLNSAETGHFEFAAMGLEVQEYVLRFFASSGQSQVKSDAKGLRIGCLDASAFAVLARPMEDASLAGHRRALGKSAFHLLPRLGPNLPPGVAGVGEQVEAEAHEEKDLSLPILQRQWLHFYLFFLSADRA